MIRRLLLALLLVVAARPAAHAQSADGALLKLVPLSGVPIRINAVRWASLPRDTVQAADAGGANHAPYEKRPGRWVRYLVRLSVREAP